MAGTSATVVATVRPQADDPAPSPRASTLDTHPVCDDALTIPVALCEQEFSQWRFQYTIWDRVADIVQPVLFYYGRLIWPIRVVGMAALRDMPASPHLSVGYGFVYLFHFASCVPKIVPWQEYKEGVKKSSDQFNPALRILNGALTVAQGPGMGIAEPKEVLKRAEVMNQGG